MSKTTIEWASHTLNFYDWSCQKVSPGCKNCYAEHLAMRRGMVFNKPPEWRDNAWKELRTMKPGSVVFVNSMSDSYHELVPVEWIHRIHNAARQRPDITFLLLTKRPERAYGLSPHLDYPPNLWVGTSVENEDYLWRLDYLLRIPAAGHFVSAEPLLSRLPGLERYLHPTRAVFNRFDTLLVYPPHQYPNYLKWVILGAESGQNRRDFNKDWAREIRDMCQLADVPFLFKQGSGWHSGMDRELDGRTWDGTPFQPYENQVMMPVSPVVEQPRQLTLF